MINLKQLLLAALCTTFPTINYAQYGRLKITNGITLGGGTTQLDILTKNFKTTRSEGWSITASNTCNLLYDWYNLSYGMQLTDNTINIEGLRFEDGVLYAAPVSYKILQAQVAFLFHIKVLPKVLTIDIGPMAQYNSKLEMLSTDEDNLFIMTSGSNTVLAKEIEPINQFNFNGAAGATLGFKFLKVRLQYIYGFTNMLNKLNEQKFNSGTIREDFRGNQSMLVFSALIAF